MQLQCLMMQMYSFCEEKVVHFVNIYPHKFVHDSAANTRLYYTNWLPIGLHVT